ncbi:hypothetical protein NGB36_00300 [Streptomyces sp. RB6PN25]|uniref:Uncharacterized protein n=1 Tax=Streptomyces humicola TaxID=2953240 RepID=A0ABT1PN45_9ACTN|nr:hypothetical protein [Streptomyces humicola]MCQ4079096.1 hypothetical protein [Streptomyces humicola]
MKATQSLHELQSLWLDNITRGMLDSGQLQHSSFLGQVHGGASSRREPSSRIN